MKHVTWTCVAEWSVKFAEHIKNLLIFAFCVEFAIFELKLISILMAFRTSVRPWTFLIFWSSRWDWCVLLEYPAAHTSSRIIERKRTLFFLYPFWFNWVIDFVVNLFLNPFVYAFHQWTHAYFELMLEHSIVRSLSINGCVCVCGLWWFRFFQTNIQVLNILNRIV